VVNRCPITSDIPPIPFCFRFFQLGSPTFYLELDWYHDPPPYASHVAGMTGACHHCLVLVEMKFPVTFWPCLPQTMILWITSRVTGITGVNHQVWPVVFWDMVSQCSFDLKILLPLPPECWVYRYVPPLQACPFLIELFISSSLSFQWM
jgi:hypothetical protein